MCVSCTNFILMKSNSDLLSKIIHALSQLFYLFHFALLYTATQSSVNFLHVITKHINPPNSFHISIYIIFFTGKMLYQIICASNGPLRFTYFVKIENFLLKVL